MIQRFFWLYKIILGSEELPIRWLHFIDAKNGQILGKQNLIAHVTGTGKVYEKHPNNSVLTINNLYRLNGTGRLNGTFVEIINDQTTEAYSSSHSFNYTTSSTHFDEVALYYHVDNFRHNFVEGLAGGSLGFSKVKAHAHSNSYPGPNNAWFNPSTLDIYFGDGNGTGFFFMAREDKVVHHEYTHRIIYDINTGLTSKRDTEEGGINEGTPDYFAGSFTGRPIIFDYAAPSVQRNMNNPTISSYSDYLYQKDIVPPIGEISPHTAGEFFSTILWSIRNEIGAVVTDQLVFDTLFRITGAPNFLGFRTQMLVTEQAAYQGTYDVKIQNIFASYGIGDSTLSVDNFVLTNPGGSFPSFSWNATTGSTSFKIYRKCSNGYYGDCTSVYEEIGTTTSTFYTDYSVNQRMPGQHETYFYAAKAFGNNGIQSEYSNSAQVTAQPSYFKAATSSAPESFGLAQNYPNPFNPSTNIYFDLPEISTVSIKVYNVMGQLVSTLVDQTIEPGSYSFIFDGSSLSSGFYLARIDAVSNSGEVFTKSINMQLIK